MTNTCSQNTYAAAVTPWMESAITAPETQNLDRTPSIFEVAVIGGGLTGLSAALHLAKSGRSVALFEARVVGYGASVRNNRKQIHGKKHDPQDILRIFGEARGENLIKFAGEAVCNTFRLIEEYDIKCDARRTGWLQPASSIKRLEAVHKRARQWKEIVGDGVKILGREETARLTGSSTYFGGWIDPRGGVLNPLSYVRGLAKACIERGVQVFEDAGVDRITRSNGNWSLVVGEKEIRASKVVIATNGYTSRLLPILDRAYLPATSIQISSKPLSQTLRERVIPANLPISDSKRILNYMRYTPDNRFIFGGRGSFSTAQPARFFQWLKYTATRMFPELQQAEWEYEWGGNVALTIDGLPHIHNLDEGLYAVLGYNGRGLALSTQIGRLTADLLLGADLDALPVPVTPVRRVPLHTFRRPAMEIAASYYRVLDALGY